MTRHPPRTRRTTPLFPRNRRRSCCSKRPRARPLAARAGTAPEARGRTTGDQQRWRVRPRKRKPLKVLVASRLVRYGDSQVNLHRTTPFAYATEPEVEHSTGALSRGVGRCWQGDLTGRCWLGQRLRDPPIGVGRARSGARAGMPLPAQTAGASTACADHAASAGAPARCHWEGSPKLAGTRRAEATAERLLASLCLACPFAVAPPGGRSGPAHAPAASRRFHCASTAAGGSPAGRSATPWVRKRRARSRAAARGRRPAARRSSLRRCLPTAARGRKVSEPILNLAPAEPAGPWADRTAPHAYARTGLRSRRTRRSCEAP